MGRAAALLTPRYGGFAALAAGLAAYYAASESLWNASLWWDVAWLCLALIPAVFAVVWFLLPFWRARGLGLVAVGFAVLTVLLSLADFETLANFSKLVTMTLVGFWFLTFFESVLWVALVASVIPLVDALSVWRGPTRHIVDKQPEVFTTLSFAFRIPGERGTANLGLPDLLFFALFLATAARFNLRPGWTWLAMAASFGLTIVLTVAFDVVGLPALPLLSLAFLAANADLLWRAVKRREWGISRSE
ncbi:MAG: hypothetical protein M3P42_07650 [Actinomycetota bacterium]|nr:hypothetical protein [Actinomycetota bacterium]